MNPTITSWETPARALAPGMGEAVAARTILRKKPSGEIESWGDVAYRVALGNSMLRPEDAGMEFEPLHKHLRQASVLMSGRHLQHGDETQPSRNIEVFSNCSTSASTFILFYLLLNGSGVGRAYDDDMMIVDWANKMPHVISVIREDHPDVLSGEIGKQFVNPTWPTEGREEDHYMAAEVFEVPDSREGWAKALEKIEYMTWTGKYADKVLLLDFSHVRERGAPIKGMQNRPASGPGTLMEAISKIAAIKGSGMDAWHATLHADHYAAECVLVGGARRAARMATKTWRDKSVFQFISVKKGGVLWSSNNSVTVDEEFWKLVKASKEDLASESTKTQLLAEHAKEVFEAICLASYHDGTGEPGLINVERLSQKNDGVEVLFDGNYAESERFKLDDCTKQMTAQLAKVFSEKKFTQITNPCVPGDTPILTRDGYVEIASVIGQEVEVWNGKKFSKVTPFSTGHNPTLRVEFSDGTELRCTPTHKFILAGTRYKSEGARVQADQLTVGDKLAKYTMPVVESGEAYGDANQAYSQGFYSGDGCADLKHSWVYWPKFPCIDRLIGTVEVTPEMSDRKTWRHGEMRDKGWVPVNGSAQYCLNWLAGVLDADGTVCTDKQLGQSFQLSSIDRDFLVQIRLMLTRLGVQAKVCLDREGRACAMPDGRGGMKDYDCKAQYRLLICNFDAWNLVNELGMKLSRLSYTAGKPNRSAARFVTVEAIHNDEPCDTFCFTEPENHTGTFNGIVTGQCGEISLAMVGAYCVIADVVPFHAEPTGVFGTADRFYGAWDADAEDAYRTAVRALIRTNTMNALYGKEVKRTNRIGVGFTGLHEYAWARFGYGWKDLVNESKSIDFWRTMGKFSRACVDEAKKYSRKLGVEMPHTVTTVKPAGTTSKIFGMTEGAHLPSMREFLRWVQFRNGDPIIAEYAAMGYPTRELKTYSGTTIVGFPTAPLICTLGMGDKLVTAAEATPEEQYEYLRLLEKWWIDGFSEEHGCRHTYGNQVSYTLKYLPEVTSYEQFRQTLMDGQSTVKCCSVMPQSDATAYEYQPEQPVTAEEYLRLVAAIKAGNAKEDIGREHMECSGGACPIEFREEKAA